MGSKKGKKQKSKNRIIKIILIIISIIALFEFLTKGIPSNIKSEEKTLVKETINNDQFEIKKGDVIISHSQGIYNILGHAAIAISSNEVLQIRGYGANPKLIPIDKYLSSRKGTTRVYRHKDENIASAAADWAMDTYQNSNSEFHVTPFLSSKGNTYCSKLVWQAYYYGPNTPSANGPVFGFRLPYELPKTINGLELVKTYEISNKK